MILETIMGIRSSTFLIIQLHGMKFTTLATKHRKTWAIGRCALGRDVECGKMYESVKQGSVLDICDYK